MAAGNGASYFVQFALRCDGRVTGSSSWGCRGGGPGRRTARMALRRATWQRWWSHSSVMRMAWSGRWEFLELAALRLLATPRSCLEIPSWRQRATKFSGAVCGCFRAKVQRLGANDGDACGCRNPLGGVVVGIRPALRLRVKTLDLTVSTTAAECVVTLLGASLWSPESTWSHPNVFGGKCEVFCVFSFFSLICFV
jgi:hypothetical protein